tara:strand:- start:382 stop:1173 length:792 start_codon:yes stop_codon:yes gene_type:complete
MARRELAEINAGSMADIAFLLLVFFLVVTTMNSDSGMKRLLPPPLPPEFVPPPVIARNVYEVLVNFNNDLLVEEKVMNVKDLKAGAKEFLLSNGDNVLRPLGPAKEDFPIREPINRDSLNGVVRSFEVLITQLETELEATSDVLKVKAIEKDLKTANSSLNSSRAEQYAFEFFGKYAPLPSSALISVQNDNSTDYETYVLVNNELEAAIRELRDEICLAKFGVLFNQLDENDEEDKKKILAIREVYPQRISEAEPLDVKGFGG